MTQRESFEKWAVGKGYDIDKNRKMFRSWEYSSYPTCCAWEAYQAAQAALIADIVDKLEAEKAPTWEIKELRFFNATIDKAIEIVKKAGE